MGVGKMRQKIKEALPKWGCFGRFGYGQGRGFKEFGDRILKKKSACLEFCPRASACRSAHHDAMDKKYPDVAKIVVLAGRYAKANKADVAQSVMAAIQLAEGNGVEGLAEIRRINSQFGVETVSDHYICGQFVNMQNGIEGRAPSYERPVPPPKEEVTSDGEK